MYALQVYRELDRDRRLQLRREARGDRLRRLRRRLRAGQVDLVLLRLADALILAGLQLKQRRGVVANANPNSKSKLARLG